MRGVNTAEKHEGHGFSQIKLTNWLLNNLSQFNLKPTTKLVLLYLSGCYNPKHADVFPKQKTIALQMGISERSVISAIQELHKEGLVISERKYTNRYKFTSRILNLGGMVEDLFQPEEIAEEKSKNCSNETEKFAPPCNRTTSEQEIEQPERDKKNCSSVEKENRGGNVYLFQSEEDRILEEYARPRAKKSVEGYIKRLKESGSAKKIILEYKTKKWYTKPAAYDAYGTQEQLKCQAEDAKTAKLLTDNDREAWIKLGKQWGKI